MCGHQWLLQNGVDPHRATGLMRVDRNPYKYLLSHGVGFQSPIIENTTQPGCYLSKCEFSASEILESGWHGLWHHVKGTLVRFFEL